jgi:hypothetical protein
MLTRTSKVPLPGIGSRAASAWWKLSDRPLSQWWRRPTSTRWATESTPTTVQPARASRSARVPVPQETSSTRVAAGGPGVAARATSPATSANNASYGAKPRTMAS